MIFSVQASNPKYWKNVLDEEDSSLSDAIETIFPLNTEYAFLEWNHIFIPLSYKYDISYMIDDIISMINNIVNNEAGEMSIHWLPDTFRTDWKLRWENKKINVFTKWERTCGNLELLLNEHNNIEIETDSFINEWKSIICKVSEALLQNGYSPSDLHGMKSLIEVKEKIKGFGVRYC